MPAYADIDVQEVKKRLAEGWTPFVLDVRSQAEADQTQIDITDRLQPHTDVAAIAADLPVDRDVLVYCRMGGRSAMACNTLAGGGLTRLFNLSGGITAWNNA